MKLLCLLPLIRCCNTLESFLSTTINKFLYLLGISPVSSVSPDVEAQPGYKTQERENSSPTSGPDQDPTSPICRSEVQHRVMLDLGLCGVVNESLVHKISDDDDDQEFQEVIEIDPAPEVIEIDPVLEVNELRATAHIDQVKVPSS